MPTVGRHRVAASPPSLRVRCGHNGPIVDNRLSSLSNYDAYNPLYLYRHPGFSDRKLTVPAGNPVNDSNLWPCCNDMLSSHNWV